MSEEKIGELEIVWGEKGGVFREEGQAYVVCPLGAPTLMNCRFCAVAQRVRCAHPSFQEPALPAVKPCPWWGGKGTTNCDDN